MVSGWFDEQFEKTLENCQLLSRAEAEHFINKGFVLIRDAFNRDIAKQVVDCAWEELKAKHGVERDDPNTWLRRGDKSNPYIAYFRVGPQQQQLKLKDEAPTAFQTQIDVLGGPDRLSHAGNQMAWSFHAIANLGLYDESTWIPPTRYAPGWHKDGWHFRHFLDSPEQGLLTVPIFSDIQPRSGGTVIATDSIAPVARMLANFPQGFHADSVQGSGYVIPYLLDQCHDFQELTGNAGDMAILHPYMMHRVNRNPSDRHRFIANVAVVLNEPMRFIRSQDDKYSLTELAVLRALDNDGLNFEPTTERRAYVPMPFRDPNDAGIRRKELQLEMASMRSKGLITPAWGATNGYMSNAQAGA